MVVSELDLQEVEHRFQESCSNIQQRLDSQDRIIAYLQWTVGVLVSGMLALAFWG